MCLILLCGILLYAYDLFILRKKKIDIKKNKSIGDNQNLIEIKKYLYPSKKFL